jgi:hypothetical protein
MGWAYLLGKLINLLPVCMAVASQVQFMLRVRTVWKGNYHATPAPLYPGTLLAETQLIIQVTGNTVVHIHLQ